MTFWDASAIVPLLAAESTTPALQALVAKDPSLLVWWSSAVECVSALTRLEREGALDDGAMELALSRLGKLAASWHEVEPSDTVRETATRFLRVHPLRAADSLQLAAAFVAAERRPSSLELVTVDDRLATAARKEGFLVVNVPAT